MISPAPTTRARLLPAPRDFLSIGLKEVSGAESPLGRDADAAGRRVVWHRRFSPLLLEIVLVLCATTAALLVRLALNPVLNDDSPFLTFVIAVMVCSLWAGGRAGVLTTLLSAVPAWFLVLKPYQSELWPRGEVQVEISLFMLLGFTVSWVNEAWHRARRQLRAHEEFLSAVLENTPSGVLVLDEEGCVSFANSAAAALFGLKSGLLVGRSYREIGLLAPGEEPGLQRLLAAAEGPSTLRLHIRDASNTPVELVAKVTRLFSAHAYSGVVLSLPTN